ncbi:hypothetical protein SNOG_20028 [Parastagonospora nodorum SN15]|uniref:Uncharacterized protein n=1 Tax=Phaeosphaeria nodorum (strain SN15 / ATCC MYA-4574 / FGSC 10173) TaxID=321614 RepID=A9JX25_PHANO|nr:hypothetical protein SNOG_20028 [Parastagonospora nodorum SN15]EDP89874.1 hypothetical protein SNOG_20028 [Parastagonospora nodorum SN15]
MLTKLPPISSHRSITTAPTATPTIAPAVLTAPPPVDTALALAGASPANVVVALNPPTVLFAPCTILLASRDVLAAAMTGTLVSVAPQTQWLKLPANMLTQNGASDALHAMAPGSSKHDLSSRQEASDAELTQRVIGAQDEDAQHPNQFAEDEERHVDAAVQERGNPAHALVCLASGTGFGTAE